MEDNKQKHLRLLAIAYYEQLEFLEPYNVGSPMLDCKRPFGNSGYEADILEIIEAEPEDKEEDGDGYMVWSKEQYDYARELYTVHLTPYLKEHGKRYFDALTHKTSTDANAKSNIEPPMTQSNEPSIEQMNVALASFEGRKFNGYPIEKFGTNTYNALPEMKYHTSWDWLMPVVEKIEAVQLDDKRHVVVRASANVQIFYRACIITYEPDEESGDTNEGAAIQTKGETKLEAVFKAVYQFITWYNQQTTPNAQTH